MTRRGIIFVRAAAERTRANLLGLPNGQDPDNSQP